MKSTRSVLFGLLFSAAVSPAMAQESIRLQFEILKDGSTLARPEVTVIAGTAGTIEVDGVGRFDFTPTFRGATGVAVAFVIHAGDKKLDPRLVIGKNEPGTLSWTSNTRTQTVTVRVFWVQSDDHRRAEAPSQRRMQVAAERA
jgi:hypothetical protein